MDVVAEGMAAIGDASSSSMASTNVVGTRGTSVAL